MFRKELRTYLCNFQRSAHPLYEWFFGIRGEGNIPAESMMPDVVPFIIDLHNDHVLASAVGQYKMVVAQTTSLHLTLFLTTLFP